METTDTLDTSLTPSDREGIAQAVAYVDANAPVKKPRKPRVKKYATRAEGAKAYRARVKAQQAEPQSLKKISTPVLAGMLSKLLGAINKAYKAKAPDTVADQHKMAGKVMHELRTRYAIRFGQD